MMPLPEFDPVRGTVIREPEGSGPGYWAGCPQVLHEQGTHRFLLTYRQRRPRGAAPDRGWRCAVAASGDGMHFDDIWAVTKDELRTASMERFCLTSWDGREYRLYISYVDPVDNRWRIDVLTATDAAGFDITSARPVLTAATTGTEGVKDPLVLRRGPTTYLFASFAAARPFTAAERQRAHGTGDIYNLGMTTHPTGVATSADGTSFRWHGTALDVGAGWDRYQARLSCVVPAGSGYAGCYDGSGDAAENYEERCGVAVSADLWHWRRLTPDRPWVAGPFGTGSVRYLDALAVAGQWWVYYEMARADGAHDLRVQRLDMNWPR